MLCKLSEPDYFDGFTGKEYRAWIDYVKDRGDKK